MTGSSADRVTGSTKKADETQQSLLGDVGSSRDSGARTNTGKVVNLLPVCRTAGGSDLID